MNLKNVILKKFNITLEASVYSNCQIYVPPQITNSELILGILQA
jgi:hypothetical protein